jgi:hypothetical protein
LYQPTDSKFLDDQCRVDVDAILDRLHKVSVDGQVPTELVLKYAASVFAKARDDAIYSRLARDYTQDIHTSVPQL